MDKEPKQEIAEEITLNEFENAIHQEKDKVFTNVSSLKCFVMMPFGFKNEYDKGNLESDFVFNHIICPAIERFKTKNNSTIEVLREVDKNTAGNITKSILRNIASADICIVDITGLNPNVFFELGIRYSLRHKITILLKQTKTKMPFDISGYKCITYDCFKPNSAISSIEEFLLSGMDDYGSVDSLVFETFPDMQVNIPGVVKSVRDTANKDNIMPWDEWWNRILEMATLLKDSFDNGRFVPTVIVGISNGGLMVADLLGREVFKGVPIVSLWANRWIRDKSEVDSSCYYFDNTYNKAILQQIKLNSKNSKITVLLIDDIVFTSNTSVQATTFIKKELKENFEILFTPLYCRSLDYLDSIQNILPFGYNDGKTFEITKDQYYKRLSTSRSSMPFRKVLGRE